MATGALALDSACAERLVTRLPMESVEQMVPAGSNQITVTAACTPVDSVRGTNDKLGPAPTLQFKLPSADTNQATLAQTQTIIVS